MSFDLRKHESLKPLATILFVKEGTKRKSVVLGSISDSFGPQNKLVFVPGTKTKLQARGFEVVRGFVPRFVPGAYAKSRGGIRRQDG